MLAVSKECTKHVNYTSSSFKCLHMLIHDVLREYHWNKEYDILQLSQDLISLSINLYASWITVWYDFVYGCDMGISIIGWGDLIFIMNCLTLLVLDVM